MTVPAPDWFLVAQLLRPQGRHGELLAEPATDLPVFSGPRQVWLAEEDEADACSRSPMLLKESWRPSGKNAGRLVIKLEGVDTISGAEALAGRCLFIPSAELPPLAEGTYLTKDLIGCSLFNVDVEIGPVEDVQFPVSPDGRTRLGEAPDLLVVRQSARPEEDAALVPFVQAWLLSVDLARKQIRMRLPAGLVETTALAQESSAS